MYDDIAICIYVTMNSCHSPYIVRIKKSKLVSIYKASNICELKNHFLRFKAREVFIGKSEISKMTETSGASIVDIMIEKLL